MTRVKKRAPGGAIVLAGPDGTGKSSIVTWMKRELGADRVVYMWGRPAVLPRRSPEGTGDDTRPHDVRLYGRAVSWVKLVYVFLDYQLGWLGRVWPHSRRGGITMIDRGWYDMAVDEKRYRLRVPPKVVEILARLIPKPRLVVVLHAPSDVILQRKADLSAGEIERQMTRWREVVPASVPTVFIDASRSLDEVATSVRDEMRSRGIAP